MKKWMILVAGLGIFLAAQLAQTEPGRTQGPTRDNYEGIAASENAVWVVDRRSGRVRKCTQEFADQAPRCSAYSN